MENIDNMVLAMFENAASGTDMDVLEQVLDIEMLDSNFRFSRELLQMDTDIQKHGQIVAILPAIRALR